VYNINNNESNYDPTTHTQTHYRQVKPLLAGTPVKSKGFCWSNVLLLSCPWWWQPVHSD